MFDFLSIKNQGEPKTKGFTLVEMLVSVSIFVIVAFIVVSTLLTMSYAYKKAQRMRLLMDNLGFSIQTLSLNIREGVGYSQSDCSPNEAEGCFEFQPLDSWLSNESANVCYRRYVREDNGPGGILKCNSSCSSCSVNSGSDIISPEINITKLQFIETSGNQKSLVKIMIAGEAGANRDFTDFFIQNSVSQRNVD